MPLYGFLCESCGHDEDAIRSVEHRDDPLVCGACGSPMTRTIGVSAIAFVTRGGNLVHSHTTGGTAKGNRRPVTIGWGHGIGQGKKPTPRLKRLPDGRVEVV